MLLNNKSKIFIFAMVLVVLSLSVIQADDLQVNLVLENQGGNMEGHTPRGFKGMGTGLFAGDNLNPNFPEGDGVQIFLTFDLKKVPEGKINSAVLSSNNVRINGNPFEGLGKLNVEEIRYGKFSSDLWNLEALENGEVCVFADSTNQNFKCDISKTVQRSLDGDYEYVQLRILFDKAGNNDGNQDLVMFFIRDSNTNQPGIFELEIDMISDTHLDKVENSSDSFFIKIIDFFKNLFR